MTESSLNLSFWAKEGAFDWSWLGLNLVNERKADELVVSLEWQCYREAEQQMIKIFLDMPWTCSMATLRLLQMCELCDDGRLELPSTCPWCSNPVAVKGFSLYMQLWTYAGHMVELASCVASYTTMQGQVAPLTTLSFRSLLFSFPCFFL